MHSAQVGAYKKVQMQTISGREIEANVLTKAAMALKDCQETWENGGSNGKLDEALRFNQLIWSIFQTELTKEENPLPREVRRNILMLSAFIDRRIFEVMAYPSPEKLNAIININLNLAAGLRGSPVENQSGY
ncbi:MAG: flagellar biosynthesis regulator FlaF [Deltaproteobacteria bacterium]|nr:flagellar biosynthesis regulator FlaF [Deltaproteobacteria bacterium]